MLTIEPNWGLFGALAGVLLVLALLAALALQHWQRAECLANLVVRLETQLSALEGKLDEKRKALIDTQAYALRLKGKLQQTHPPVAAGETMT